MQGVHLHTGQLFPLVGLGTVASKPGEMQAAVAAALAAGYRAIDCASIYRNEAEVGSAIAASGIPRTEIFVTSKLWNDRRRPHDVREALQRTLADLRLTYVDLYLVHWPVCWRRGTIMVDDTETSLRECWETLEELVEEGAIRHLGVSNFSESDLAELLSYCRVRPCVNQVEAHPRLPQRALVDYCRRCSPPIVVTAYCPLGRGGKNGLLTHPTVAGIAERLGVPPSAVVLRWNVDRGVAVVPKSSNPERLRSNLDLWHFSLSAADTAALDALDDGVRLVRVPWNAFADCTTVGDYVKYGLARILTAVVFTLPLVRIDLTSFGRRVDSAASSEPINASGAQSPAHPPVVNSASNPCEASTADDPGERNTSEERHLPILIDGVDAYLATATMQTTGGHVWEAARELLRYLHAEPAALARKGGGRMRVLELGAGTGYLSMHVARDFGARVESIVATEMVEGGALRWLEQNVARNRQAGRALTGLSTAPLDWNWVASEAADAMAGVAAPPQVEGSEEERAAGALALRSPFDVVLGSDLVYNDAGVYLLPRVFRALLRRSGQGAYAYALYAHTLNRFEFADHDFFEELTKAGLAYAPVWPAGAEVAVGGANDGGGFSGELFPEQHVVIFRIEPAGSAALG